MKFRTIFILFNIVLVFSFCFIFFMPLFLLGSGYMADFWSKNWPLGGFFVLVLGVFNAFFLSNWKLFKLVEGEDWEALSSWLKRAMTEKGRINRRFVRLFVNASLLRSDMAAIEELEGLLGERKPRLLARDAVLFAAARLLKNDADATMAFVKPYVGSGGVDQPHWLSFYYAFSLILQKNPLDAVPVLTKLLAQKDPVLALLAAYLLASLCAPGAEDEARREMTEAAGKTKASLKARYNAEAWSRETEKAKSEVHIVILSKLIDEAGAWFFSA